MNYGAWYREGRLSIRRGGYIIRRGRGRIYCRASQKLTILALRHGRKPGRNMGQVEGVSRSVLQQLKTSV